MLTTLGATRLTTAAIFLRVSIEELIIVIGRGSVCQGGFGAAVIQRGRQADAWRTIAGGSKAVHRDIVRLLAN